MRDQKANCNLVELFPGEESKRELFRKLDGFVKRDLSPVIGFAPGAFTLFLHGYVYIGHLAEATPDGLRSLPGIGPVRVKKIEWHLACLGLTFGTDVSSWRRYRQRFPDGGLPSPTPWLSKQRGHLGVVKFEF